MGRRSSLASSSYLSRSDADPDYETDLDWPFGRVDSVDGDDLRETAYELFFMSCRSSPGFGGRNALAYYPSDGGDGTGAGGRAGQHGLQAATSRVKRALGLRARRLSPKLMVSHSSAGAPSSPGKVVRRPMTSAEIMRQQMRVTEQSDNRLRKTLMRTLVGQMGRRAETIILPLELLRQLKPSEFNGAHEYHIWQKRQLKILEAGLVLHPSVPLERSNAAVTRVRETVRMAETKPIDTSKNSETMRSFCNSVLALAWRTSSGGTSDVCHWADGFPLNVHIYLSLLQSIFDLRERTAVLDEVDELLELMKKAWSSLGINRVIHNVCFAWVLLKQFVLTGQVEQELLCATLSMLAEVANDAKRAERDAAYVRVLSATLASMQGWAEKRLLDYHEYFVKGAAGIMENVLPLALAVTRIVDEDVSGPVVGITPADRESWPPCDSLENRVDYYIRSSLRNAFNRILEENGNWGSCLGDEVAQDASQCLVVLATETEELAMRDREEFSPVLKRWHPVAAAVAAVTLHNCYGSVLKQYLSGVSTLTHEAIRVLQVAGKLEKVLAQIIVEDSVECEDGGKGLVRELIPFEVEAITSSLLKNWIDERLNCGRECLNRAKDTETWNPKAKSDRHAYSAVELMRLAREMVDDFFEIPIGIRDDLVQELADGLDALLQDYIAFVASCGSKHSYVPNLPVLTRCNQDSKFVKMWKKAAPCGAVADTPHPKDASTEVHHPRPSTSRGTQRLYVRLNTLHYLFSNLHYLDKALSQLPRCPPSGGGGPALFSSRSRRYSYSYFEHSRNAIQSAIQNVAEVAAYRLIFLDSNNSFYDALYVGQVANARVRPALRTLKQNLSLLASVVTDRAQPLAVREVMKASFEAFLMVLLAGGNDRAFQRADHAMVEEDLGSLKRVFATCGEGLVAEELVQREAEVVEGVVALMSLPTEQLVEDFNTAACEVSGMFGLGREEQQLPMPPMTGKWNRGDPNTILRVLCHRDDDFSSRFLKRTFQLGKRR